MSRQITEQSVRAFYNGEKFNRNNMSIRNKMMYLHGNLIAKIEDGSLFVSTCGWNTVTTKERLNGLSGVNVRTKAFQLYLNGEKWDGEMTRVP
jgi:hypothetical protein